MTAPLAALAARLPHARVTIIGDAMLDLYVTGEVERISPEAPIPILRVTGERQVLGGAGNVAANLASLGVAATLLTVAGADPAGAALAGLAAASLGSGAHVLASPARVTTTKTRYLSSRQQVLRTDRERVEPLTGADEAALLSALAAALPGSGALVLSDYGKGVLTDTVLASSIAAARAAGLPVIVDPKGRDFSRYRGATLVTPNRAELALAAGRPLAGDGEIVAAARALAKGSALAGLLVTRGPEGMTLVPADGPELHIPTVARAVFDVSGAGDTVVAVVAASLAAGAGWEAAARLANHAAGIVVGKVGTATVAPHELAAALEVGPRPPGAPTDLAAAASQAAAWRAQGLRVGFTNGCFDLLHPGHIWSLRQARAACDRLIVGLNDDASVRRLKGPTRPAQTLAARAAVLAALADVDLVVAFEEDTPLALIAALRPDVLVKGADYTRDRVVGADLVESWGGRVVLAELMPGHSTTATLARLSGA